MIVPDAVMVARGDLGVEADIATVPLLQKDIIRRCNQRRIPVITATQMLDSMHTGSELPTRAEASDVANAVLDGTDAVMLSGESAIGQNPRKAVSTMSRICREAERMIKAHSADEVSHPSSSRATLITEAVTLGAFMAAEKLNANMIAVATHSGRTAMADLQTTQRQVPIVALTDNYHTAQKMALLGRGSYLHSSCR
ncbi:MAG: pyruvate kinase [Planctomycetaceae bacterium]